MRVTIEQLAQALRPYLGTPLVTETSLCAHLAQVINAYAPYRDSFEDLARRVEKCLFDELYAILGLQMILRLDDGRLIRVRMRELPELADEAMGAMFEGMQVYSVSYDNLKDYAMRCGSLSAMRVLYERYRTFQRAEETAELRRVLQERYPGDTDWLADQPSANPEIKEEI